MCQQDHLSTLFFTHMEMLCSEDDCCDTACWSKGGMAAVAVPSLICPSLICLTKKDGTCPALKPREASHSTCCTTVVTCR